MKIFFILIAIVSIYGNKLSIGFASINPPRDIKATPKEIDDDIVKERHLNIKVKLLKFKSIPSSEAREISESLDEFSQSLYNALNRAGPSLATKEQKEAKFNDIQYKGVALTPSNIKKLWVFHKDRSKYGIKFLSSLSKKQELDILIYQKIAKTKWKKFGANLEKKGKIKPTIAVFNNFSKAQTYTYPVITAKYIRDEEYEKMNEIIESKSIEALKKAFSVGVINSSIDTTKKIVSEKNIKTSQLKASDLTNSGGTGGF